MSKNKCGSSLVAFCGVVAGLASAAAAGIAYLNHITMKKVEENEGQFNTMHSVVFNNLNVDIEENIENAYLNTVLGNMEVTTSVPANENLYIEVFNLLGNTTIIVPEGVNVVYGAEDIKGNVVSDVETSLEDDASGIYIFGKNIFGNIIIKTVAEEQE